VIVEQIASPFYPSVTRQITSRQTEALRAHYSNGVRLIAAVCLGALAVLGALAHPLLGVWLGDDFAAMGTWALRFLLMAYTAAAFFTLPSVVADAAGRPGIPAGILAVASLAHIPLVLIGIHLWGIPGAALGLLAGMLILLAGAAVIHIRLPEMPPLRETFGALRGSLVAALLTGGAAVLLARTPFPSLGIVPLLLSLAAAGLLYTLLLFAFRGMFPSDFRRLLEALRGLRRDAETMVHENRVRAARER
jgi:O-antigen/teichoic acid export membrane protein